MDRTIIPNICPTCYGPVVNRKCDGCKVSFGAERRKPSVRDANSFHPKLSRREINDLRSTYMREPESVKFFLYNFFSKTLRDGRLDFLTYDEMVLALQETFPNCEIKPEWFEAYKRVWVERERVSAIPPVDPAN